MTWSKLVLMCALFGGCLSVQAAPDFNVGDEPVITLTRTHLKGLACVGILGFIAYKAWRYWFAQPHVSKKPAADTSPKSLKVPPVQTKPLVSEVVHIPVHQQDGAYCGYHAAYNGVTLLKWILGGERGAQPVLTSEFNVPLFDLDGWKKRIIAERQKVNPELSADLRNGMWLEADPELRMVVTHKDMCALTDFFTIIQNVETFHPVQIYNDQERKELIAVISSLHDSRDGCAHLFLIGNMRELRGRIAGTRGHWIAVVVHRKDNKIIYYVMDSLSDDIEQGIKRDRSSMITGLQRIIEGGRVLALLQQAPHFATLTDSIHEQLHNQALRSSIKDRLNTVFSRMEEIRTTARKFGLLNESAFRHEYGERLLNHITIMEKRIAEEKEKHFLSETECEVMRVTLESLRHDFQGEGSH